MQVFNTISNHPIIVKHGPTLALIGAVVCLLALLLVTGLDMRKHAQTKTINYTPQSIQAIKKTQRTRYRINDVVSANLFGDPAPKKAIKDAPKTTLDLTLQGILSASDDSVGRAIISSGRNKKAQLYSVGEEIKGAGASIKEIRSKEVIINRNGAIESLPLKKATSKGDSSIFTAIKNSSSENVLVNTQVGTPSIGKPISTNGEPRKIRKPNFSGLDRALEKLGEI